MIKTHRDFILGLLKGVTANGRPYVEDASWYQKPDGSISVMFAHNDNDPGEVEILLPPPESKSPSTMSLYAAPLPRHLLEQALETGSFIHCTVRIHQHLLIAKDHHWFEREVARQITNCPTRSKLQQISWQFLGCDEDYLILVIHAQVVALGPDWTLKCFRREEKEDA